MNLVGKIFTVLILVMSVFFAAMAVSVYAVHKNWKKAVTNPNPLPGEQLGLKEQLDQQKTRREELEDQKLNLEEELAEQESARIDAVKRLENEKTRLADELNRFKTEHNALVKAEREAVAAMKGIQETLAKLRGDLDTANNQVDEARQDRDAHFKEVVRLTDALHQSVNELKRLRQRQIDLANDLAKAMEVLRKFGLVPDPGVYTGTPPDVDGVVLAVPRPDLVEISIGADDGLMKGHVLQVYRLTGSGPTYVGRIEVVKTDPDRAACKVDPKWQQSHVQRGDRVTALQLDKPNA
jgi:hypothetical protein